MCNQHLKLLMTYFTFFSHQVFETYNRSQFGQAIFQCSIATWNQWLPYETARSRGPLTILSLLKSNFNKATMRFVDQEYLEKL